MNKYAVILAGGVGERFWPLSRKNAPKYLWNVVGGKKCLLSLTFERVAKLLPAKNILVITNREQIKNIKKACPEIPPSQIIGEPCVRDTTAAIGLAAILVDKKAKGQDAAFAVFPSDQLIEDTQGFVDTMLSAFEVANEGNRLVTIGIQPTYPATGFGYIQRGEQKSTALGKYFKVSRFYEKPNLDRAEKYVSSGNFYWNAGIFVWKVSSILAALKKNVPDSYEALIKIKNAHAKGEKIKDLAERYYPKIEKISIDFSVMERAKNAFVVPQTFDWDDVGSWNAIERHLAKDDNRNIACGELYSAESSDCVVFDADGRATALLGVRDLVVVHAKDATLICRKEYAERLKDLVKQLPDKYR